MAGDRLGGIPAGKTCPRCQRDARTHAKAHCDRPGCVWATCECGDKFELYGPHDYHPSDIPQET
jgi:hypothetical protein